MIERTQSGPVSDIEVRLARLTPGERMCLMLVIEHWSSKEIAQQLGISPHTVDQRIRRTLKTLGVSNRTDAARVLRISMEIEASSRAVLPFATRRQPRNDMHMLWRLFWIIAIFAGVELLSGLFLADAEALALLFRRW